MNPGVKHRTDGLRILLLVLLLIAGTKQVNGIRKPTCTPACRSSFYIQMEGDVPFPGVYEYCNRPDRRALMETAGDEALPFDPAGLQPGDRIIVQKEGAGRRFEKGEMSAFYKVALGIPLSINRETEEGLTALPGIGPSLSKAIVEERRKNGRFETLEEIMTVPGIGPGLYKRIKPYLTLKGP